MKKKIVIFMGMSAMALAFIVVLAGCASLFAKKDTSSETAVFWDTSQLQGVSKVTDDGVDKNWAKVSADGTQLLYTELGKDGFWNISLLRNINSTAKTQLVIKGTCPAWYEDNNRYLYVVTESGSNKIMRSAINGGNKTYITRTSIGQNDYRPVIRNGTILCDTDMGDGTRDLIVMKDNGTEVTFLGKGWAPAWHPNGGKFLFVRRTGNSSDSTTGLRLCGLRERVPHRGAENTEQVYSL